MGAAPWTLCLIRGPVASQRSGVMIGILTGFGQPSANIWRRFARHGAGVRPID